MEMQNKIPIKIAILDLYEGAANEGMRCIKEIVTSFQHAEENNIVCEEFEVRQRIEIPPIDFDIYISTGGPGSPLESKDSSWEVSYFNWLSSIIEWNRNPLNTKKKYIFFICHSFQMACIFFNIGTVTKRKSTAFGVFPIHMLEGASKDFIFGGLNNPFYAVDSRDFQVIEPDYKKLEELGANLLCIEKERPHVHLERAIMGIRFNEYMIGTQFHPEADAKGMSMYLQRADKKITVIENHGLEKWISMIEQLNDPEKISMTNIHILPNFMGQAIKALS
jgi:homoserine O-succinyltransferase